MEDEIRYFDWKTNNFNEFVKACKKNKFDLFNVGIVSNMSDVHEIEYGKNEINQKIVQQFDIPNLVILAKKHGHGQGSIEYSKNIDPRNKEFSKSISNNYEHPMFEKIMNSGYWNIGKVIFLNRYMDDKIKGIQKIFPNAEIKKETKPSIVSFYKIITSDIENIENL